MTESRSTYKRKTYEIQRYKHIQVSTVTEIRVQTKFPHVRWTLVWNTINKSFLPRDIRTTWYMVVHDILPTNARLRKINLHTDGKCNHCDHCDTVTHRYTMCMNTQPLWEWTRKRIACYLRSSPQNVLDDWICFQTSSFTPRKGKMLPFGYWVT